MANHTITVYDKRGFTQNDLNKNSNVGLGGKQTSAKNQFGGSKKPIKNIARGINIVSHFNVGGALSMMNSGVGVVLSGIQTVGSTIQRGVNIYSSFMEAKTGEIMRYNNLRAKVSAYVHPIDYLKRGVWDYGVIQQMKINRQNEELNYNRELTGNIIYSKSYNKGIF